MTTEAGQSHNKAHEQAKRIEARRACKPLIDSLTALRSALSGGSSGTVKAVPTPAVPELTLPERVVKVIEATAARVKREGARQEKGLSAKERRDAAEGLREAADRAECGS